MFGVGLHESLSVCNYVHHVLSSMLSCIVDQASHPTRTPLLLQCDATRPNADQHATPCLFNASLLMGLAVALAYVRCRAARITVSVQLTLPCPVKHAIMHCGSSLPPNKETTAAAMRCYTTKCRSTGQPLLNSFSTFSTSTLLQAPMHPTLLDMLWSQRNT